MSVDLSISPPQGGSVALLRNVVLFDQLVDRVVDRAEDLPGMACFYGYSGLGKTRSAVHAANRTRSYYIEMGDSWTKKRLADAILREIGLGQMKATIADKIEHIVAIMSENTRRPLIVDEADFVVQRGMVDVLREIHDKSRAPVILIGEETMPTKLRVHERAHNRMLDWVAAEPCSMGDTKKLAELRLPDVDVADDLLTKILKVSGGRARRIAVNLEKVRAFCAADGLDSIELGDWSGTFFTGEPPKRRAVAA